MVCSNCGHALGPDDQYCGGCGAYLTDAPDEEHGQDEHGRQQLDEASADPQENDQWAVPYAPAQERPPSRSAPSTGRIAAGVAAAVVLVAFLLLWVLRPDSEESAPTDAAPAATATTAAPSGATPAPTDGGTSTTSPTATPTESPTVPPVAEIDLPGSAEQCNNVGSFVVYRGNTTTSCPFAENVGRAFADVEQPVTAQVTLDNVSSPVTGLDYDLTCEFTTPVRCTGGNDAVVYLVPAS